MINFSVKPSSYTGVSDTNGGGYVDGLGATYANFCSSSAGPLYTNIEPTTYGYDSTGLYDITHSMTVPTGVICYCRYADDSASTTLYFYAYLVNADNWQMVYLPVGGTGISSKAVIDDAISNAEAGDELLLLAVGGALADPVFAATLQLAGNVVLIESVSSSPATYEITASIDATLDGRHIRGVNESGQVIRRKNKSLRPTIKPLFNGVAIDIFTGSNLSTRLESIIIDGSDNSGYRFTDGIKALNSDTLTWTGDLYNVTIKGCSGRGLLCYGYKSGINVFCDFDNNNYGMALSRNSGCFSSCSFSNNAVAGIECNGTITLSNCVLIANGVTGIASGGSALLCTATRCLFDGHSSFSGDIYAGQSSLTFILDSCILNSAYTVQAANSGVVKLNNCYCTASFGTAPAIDIARITDTPPFVGGAGVDKYMLDPDHASFASYYNNDTGEIYAGAYGPKVAAGTGGTGILRLAGTGGFVG